MFIPSQTLRNRESSTTSPNTRSHNKAEIHIDAYTNTGFEFVSDIGHELRNENGDKIMSIALGTKRVVLSHTSINLLNLCRQTHYKPHNTTEELKYGNRPTTLHRRRWSAIKECFVQSFNIWHKTRIHKKLKLYSDVNNENMIRSNSNKILSECTRRRHVETENQFQHDVALF